MPVGMTNMLTTACSNPCAKKMKIGSQAVAILPTVEVEVMAKMTPKQTIQLQRIALTKTVTMPAKPIAALAVVLASATAMMRAASPDGATVNMLVRTMASRTP